MTIKTHLPKCRDEIKKHETTQPELHAKKLLWAFGRIQEEGRTLNWKQITTLSNVRKDKALESLPYLKDMAEPEVYERIRELL